MEHKLTVGPNKVCLTTKIPRKKNVQKIGKRGELRLKVVRALTGYNFYQRRIMELLKNGNAAQMKRGMRLCKSKVGTHKRALKMINNLQETL